MPALGQRQREGAVTAVKIEHQSDLVGDGRKHKGLQDRLPVFGRLEEGTLRQGHARLAQPEPGLLPHRNGKLIMGEPCPSGGLSRPRQPVLRLEAGFQPTAQGDVEAVVSLGDVQAQAFAILDQPIQRLAQQGQGLDQRRAEHHAGLDHLDPVRGPSTEADLHRLARRLDGDKLSPPPGCRADAFQRQHQRRVITSTRDGFFDPRELPVLLGFGLPVLQLAAAAGAEVGAGWLDPVGAFAQQFKNFGLCARSAAGGGLHPHFVTRHGQWHEDRAVHARLRGEQAVAAPADTGDFALKLLAAAAALPSSHVRSRCIRNSRLPSPPTMGLSPVHRIRQPAC